MTMSFLQLLAHQHVYYNSNDIKCMHMAAMPYTTMTVVHHSYGYVLLRLMQPRLQQT